MLPSRYLIKTNSIAYMFFLFSTFLLVSGCNGPKSGDNCKPNRMAWFPVRYTDMRVTCPQVVEKAQLPTQPKGKQ